MRHYILAAMLILLTVGSSFGQSNEIWTAFEDKKTELIGYRDSKGNIKIPPRFTFSIAHQFKNIIAVYENTGKDKYSGYYLLKNGRKIGIENVYMRGNDPDCEHEEKIRFRDKKTGLVGFFNKNGDIIIPAVYNDATPFRNNVAAVLKNARRVCQNGKKYSDKNKCEHPLWKGGQTLLINEKNEILIENFRHSHNTDWFSLKITDKMDSNPVYDVFKGKNNKYYSFVNFKKEFTLWLESVFLNSEGIDSLGSVCFSNITFWSGKNQEWVKQEKNDFLRKNKELLVKEMDILKKNKTKYTVLNNPTEPFIFRSKENEKYFDLCNNYLSFKYPAFDVVDYVNKKHFFFFKSDRGYKLINMNIKDDKFMN